MQKVQGVRVIFKKVKQRKVKVKIFPKPELAIVPAFHRDYRIVLNDVWAKALKRPDAALVLRHRDRFERLDANEHGIAALIRALGKLETQYWEAYGQRIAEDGFSGSHWKDLYVVARGLLNTDLGGMDGGLCYEALRALGVNAGFTDAELD